MSEEDTKAVTGQDEIVEAADAEIIDSPCSRSETADKAIAVVHAWQSQSYWPIKGWSAPGKGTAPQFYIQALNHASDVLPTDVPAPEGWEWLDEWIPDDSTCFGTTDNEGWFYASSFDRLHEQLRTRAATGQHSSTSIVRKRRWLRTATCADASIRKRIDTRISSLVHIKENIESFIRDKEFSIKSVQFYEENRSFVYAQSLHLATQGTQNTLILLKEVMMKAKRFAQFLSERAQLEKEFSLKMEILGRKFGSDRVHNYINNVTTVSDAGVVTAANAAAIAAAAAINNSGAAHRKNSSIVAGFNRLTRGSATQEEAKEHFLGASTSDGSTSSNANSDNSQQGHIPADGDAAVTGTSDVNSRNSGEQKGPEKDDNGSSISNKDSAEVVFEAISKVCKLSASRMRDFSGNLGQSIADSFEQMIVQIQIVLKDARATFRKNSDICRLCESSVKMAYDNVQKVHNSAVGVAVDEIAALNEELETLRGSHMTAVDAHRKFFQKLKEHDPTVGDAIDSILAGGGLETDLNFGVANISAIEGENSISGGGSDSITSAMIRRARTRSSSSATTAAQIDDLWLNIQRYRQCVRDSQEALCVLISEHMDLEMHQQILANKVHSLFTSTTQSYAHEQATCLVDQHNDFASAMNGFISRMKKIGPPHPVLQSPFAKLQEAFNEPVAGVSEKSQRTLSQDGEVEDYVHKDSEGVLSTEGTTIQYEDFANSMGVFSFTKLYRDPLPTCPGVLLSGDVEWLKALHIGTDYIKLQRETAWHKGYLVATSDGFVHLINRRKCNVPDLSFYLKHCELVKVPCTSETAGFYKRVFQLRPLVVPASDVAAVMKRAGPSEAIYLRCSKDFECQRWMETMQEPYAVASYVDERVEEETKAAMLESTPIIRGETGRVDLNIGKYQDGRHEDPIDKIEEEILNAPVTAATDTTAGSPAESSMGTTTEGSVGTQRPATDAFDLRLEHDVADQDLSDDEEAYAKSHHRSSSLPNNARGASLDYADQRRRLRSSGSGYVPSTSSADRTEFKDQRSRLRTTGSKLQMLPDQEEYHTPTHKNGYGSFYRNEAWIRVDGGSEGPKPAQLIPVTDKSVPLAKKHSNLIMQYEQALKEEKEKNDKLVKQKRNTRIKEAVVLQALDMDSDNEQDRAAGDTAPSTGGSMQPSATHSRSGSGDNNDALASASFYSSSSNQPDVRRELSLESFEGNTTAIDSPADIVHTRAAKVKRLGAKFKAAADAVSASNSFSKIPGSRLSRSIDPEAVKDPSIKPSP